MSDFWRQREFGHDSYMQRFSGRLKLNLKPGLHRICVWTACQVWHIRVSDVDFSEFYPPYLCYCTVYIYTYKYGTFYTKIDKSKHEMCTKKCVRGVSSVQYHMKIRKPSNLRRKMMTADSETRNQNVCVAQNVSFMCTCMCNFVVVYTTMWKFRMGIVT